jgi:hypothetical protein
MMGGLLPVGMIILMLALGVLVYVAIRQAAARM